MGLGGFLLFYWGLQWAEVPMRYSREGLLLPLYPPLSTVTIIFTPPPVWVAYVIYGSFLCALASFALGYRTRVSATIVLLLYAYYWILTLFHFGTSFDRLFMFMVLVFACSDSGATYSLDMLRERGSFCAARPVSILALRLIAVQITATYIGVGAQKIVLDAWQSGLVLAWGFEGRWATAPAYWILRQNIPLTVYDVLVKLITMWEVTMPVMLWSKKWRSFAFVTGALFHISIAILLSIWWFLALIPSYIVFLKPEDVRDWMTRNKKTAAALCG
jgi:hypothetical protein